MKVTNKVSIALSTLALVLSATVTSAADFNLSVSTSQVADDPAFQGLLEFKKGVEERSKGRISIRAFSSSQIGSDPDLIEQARNGTPVALFTDAARMGVYEKDIAILMAPYVFENYEQATKLTTSSLFESWVKKLHDAAGLQVFSWNFFNGARHVVNNKPVNGPEDLKGVRLRTGEAPLYVDVTNALGASATPMPWSDTYPALQMKVIDGAEVQLASVMGARLYEVTKFINKTHHFMLLTGLVGSAAWFDKLPADLKTIVREESYKAGVFTSKMTMQREAQYEKDLVSKGMVIREIDVAPFMKSTAPVYDKNNFVALRKQVNEIIKK